MITKIRVKKMQESSNGRKYYKLCLGINEDDYLNIKDYLIKSKNVSEDLVNSTFINDYEGIRNYQFWILVGEKTFSRVEKNGVLDAKFSFNVNEKGYINAVINRDKDTGKLKVMSYLPPTAIDEVWECDMNCTQPNDDVSEDNFKSEKMIDEYRDKMLNFKIPKVTRTYPAVEMDRQEDRTDYNEFENFLF